MCHMGIVLQHFQFSARSLQRKDTSEHHVSIGPVTGMHKYETTPMAFWEIILLVKSSVS